MLDVRALRMFAALAEELHFGRTADRLGLSQSVVSTQILRIEDRIGIRLFERGRRSAVSLTSAGHTFLVEVHLALEQLERAERIGRMAGRGEAGPVRIGFVTSAALSGCLTTALSAIRAQLPAIEVRAEPMDSPDQIAAVSDGRLDLGFIRPRSLYPDNIEARTIHVDDIMLAVPLTHRLASRGDIGVEDLAGETFIFPRFPDSDQFGEIACRLSPPSSVVASRHIVTRDFVTALALTSAGYGVSVVPRAIGTIGISGLRLCAMKDRRERVEMTLISRRLWNPRLIELLKDALPTVLDSCRENGSRP